MAEITHGTATIQNEFDKVIAPLAMDILRKTRPVYLLPRGCSETKLKTVGSGFFLRYLNRTVFVTASHVTRELQHGGLYVPTLEQKLESFGGMFVHTGRKDQPEEIDRADLAFIEVPAQLAARLPRDHYFTSAEWDTADTYHEKSSYLICGWPAKRNQPNPLRPKLLPRAPISYWDVSYPPSGYKRYGLSVRSHYAICFHRKRVLNNERNLARPPHFRGVSGSPCCFFHRYASRDDRLTLRAPKLVGVTIEVHKDAIIATRLTILLQFLRKYFELPARTALASNIAVNL
jgi:hypothetical protein